MSAFQALLVAAALVGLGIPASLFALAVQRLSHRQTGAVEPSARFFAYARLLTSIHDQIIEGQRGDGKAEFLVEHGALFTATIRELREYPEYRDLTLLYLEEINVTGEKKFDRVMRNELKAVESQLLEQGQ